MRCLVWLNGTPYCGDCKMMRPYFEAAIPHLPSDPRRTSEYVCAACASIIATFQHVTPEEVTAATNAIILTD